MVKISLLLAMAPLCCLAAGPNKVVITEKASRLARTLSDIANTTTLSKAPDWEKDYIVPSHDASLLKGLKLRAIIFDKSGHYSKKYTTYISEFQGTLRISVRPKQVNRVWRAHELGDVESIVIVGEPRERS